MSDGFRETDPWPGGEIATLRAQLEAVTRERDRAQLEATDAKKRMWENGHECDRLTAQNGALREALEAIEVAKCGDIRRNCHHMGEILRAIARRALSDTGPTTAGLGSDGEALRTAILAGWFFTNEVREKAGAMPLADLVAYMIEHHKWHHEQGKHHERNRLGGEGNAEREQGRAGGMEREGDVSLSGGRLGIDERHGQPGLAGAAVRRDEDRGQQSRAVAVLADRPVGDGLGPRDIATPSTPGSAVTPEPRWGMTAYDLAKREQAERPPLTVEQVLAAAPPRETADHREQNQVQPTGSGTVCDECKKAGRLDEIDGLFVNYTAHQAAQGCRCGGTGRTP